MKKTLLLIIMSSIAFLTHAQTVIFDNGPQVNLPGGGVGGVDVSSLHDGMNFYGSNNSLANGFRVAEDIVIPAGESWNIDSLVFFGYQTNSTLTSTFTDINVRIWDGIPDDPGSTVVYGDDVTNVLGTSEWSGIYRTGDVTSATCPPDLCSARPIMRNATVTGVTLASGTYWIDWQSNGTLASGPWVPQVNLGLGVTTTGNALQYVLANTAWQVVEDTVPANGGFPPYEPQGLPFLVIGSIVTGLADHQSNNNVTIYPNPVIEKVTVSINKTMSYASNYTFRIYNMLGSVVFADEHVASNKFDWNRGSLPDGVYLYELKMDNEVLKQGKMVLQ